MELTIVDNIGFQVGFGSLGEVVVVYLDAGHGGWEDGSSRTQVENYTTYPHKMYRHEMKGHHVDGWFCEGVFNRDMTDRKANYLGSRGVHLVRVADECEDTPLSVRVARANKHFNELTWSLRKKGVLGPQERPVALYVSVHANASPGHNARGTEIFTSPGVTSSDAAAHMIFDELQSIDWSDERVINSYTGLVDHWNKTPGHVYLPGNHEYKIDVKLRKDLDSREKDKEANFYVLKNTSMPAVLIEYEFFDHPVGSFLLLNNRWAEIMAQATSRGVIKYLQWKTRRLVA